MKQFACGDVVPGCRRTFEAGSEEEVLTEVDRHAREDHGLVAVPGELFEQVRGRIFTLA